MEKVYEIVRIKQEVRETEHQRVSANSPEKAAALIAREIGDEDREVFLVLVLDNQMQVVALHRAHVGDLNSSIVNPREVFKTAILNNAQAILVAHCHPSGNLKESNADRQVTRRLAEGGKILGIELLDHIIVNYKGEYNSLREKGII